MTQTERQSHDQQEAAEALRKQLRSGKSGTQLLTFELTAAEIAAAWDDFVAALPLDGIAPGDLIQRIWEDSNTLDQGVAFDEPCAYFPNAPTADVSDNADRMNGTIAGTDGTDGPYVYYVTRGSLDAILREGAQFYATFNGDAPPTAGTITIKMLVVSA